MSDEPNTEGDDKNGGPSMTVLLLVAAFLVGISWYVANALRHYGGVQDCVMQGRTNCVTLPSGER